MSDETIIQPQKQPEEPQLASDPAAAVAAEMVAGMSEPVPDPATSIRMPASQETESNTDCLSAIIMALVILWVVITVAGRVLTEFIVAGMDTTLPNYAFAGFALIETIALALPLVPLAIFWPRPRYKAVYLAWSLPLLLMVLNIPIRLLKAWDAQNTALWHIAFGLIYAALVAGIHLLRMRRSQQSGFSSLQMYAKPSFGRRLALAAALAGIFALPWLAWGALGSLADSLLQLLAALIFGLDATITLELFLFRPLRQYSGGARSDFLFGGIAAGIALMIMASGTGFPYGGLPLLLIIALPSLGWAAAGLMSGDAPEKTFKQSWPALISLIGLSAAAPFALIDADELLLVIVSSGGELLQWGMYAALLSGLIGWLFGLAWLAVRLVRPSNRRAQEAGNWAEKPGRSQVVLAVSGLIVAWAAALLIYLTLGQPGFYGEGLFVILKDQADVSSAADIQDYEQRRSYVYDTLTAHAESTQAGLRASLDRLGIDYTPYYLVNAIQVRGGSLVRLWLTFNPQIDRVLENPWLRPLPQNQPVSEGPWTSVTDAPAWNLTLIGADKVWKELGVTGQGIIVGQSDSGMQGDHPQLADSYRGAQPALGVVGNNYNWFDPWYGTTQPTDIGGHGTHTLGTVLGNQVGVAPGATWIGCVNLARNLGNPALYLDCMQFMLAPFPLDSDPFKDGKPSLGAHVLNNSWGCPDIEGCDPQSLLYGVQALRAAGVFVVVSAGNDGPDCESLSAPPAIYDEVFSVGAIDENKELASFSSIGPVSVDGSNRVKPDILAPGVDVFSSTPGNTYASYPGTSMAGPHVVGTVALMWSANPALIGDIERTEEILIQTATSYTGYKPTCEGAYDHPSTASGYGIVNAYQAVLLALEEK